MLNVLCGRACDGHFHCDVGGLESDTYFHPHWRGSSYQNTTGKEKRKTSWHLFTDEVTSYRPGCDPSPTTHLLPRLEFELCGMFLQLKLLDLWQIFMFSAFMIYVGFEANSTLIKCNLITQRSCVQMLEGLTRKLLTSFVFIVSLQHGTWPQVTQGGPFML